MNKYKVNEIFASIQGEGDHAGIPAIFIRFAGCNRANGFCHFCDTVFDSFVEMSASEIVDIVKLLDGYRPHKMLVLTGGEPLMQVDNNLLFELWQMCPDEICIETNGTIEPKFFCNELMVTRKPWITVSPKHGGEVCETLKDYAQEVKVVAPGVAVLNGEVDHGINISNMIMQEISMFRSLQSICIQPQDTGVKNLNIVCNHFAYKTVVEIDSFLNSDENKNLPCIPCKLSIQQHKVIGVK